MDNIKFSIIVPVYNVERYLSRCIESLINQTYSNIEILLIDDGSSDQSPEICDEYSKKYGNIVVYHKKNGGLSDARNYGLERASGEYILFVDSDDYINKDSCQSFYSYLKEHDKHRIDIVSGNIVRLEESKKKYEMFNQSIKISDGATFLKTQLLKKSFFTAACRNLYRKKFLMNKSLYFRKGIYHEDEHWTPRVFISAKKVLNTNIAFYVHVIREESITQKKDQTKNGLDLIEIYKDLKKEFVNLDDKELKELLLDNLVLLYLEGVYKTKGKVTVEKEDLLFLKKHSRSLKNKSKVRVLSINTRLYYFYYYMRKNLINKELVRKKS